MLILPFRKIHPTSRQLCLGILTQPKCGFLNEAKKRLYGETTKLISVKTTKLDQTREPKGERLFLDLLS